MSFGIETFFSLVFASLRENGELWKPEIGLKPFTLGDVPNLHLSYDFVQSQIKKLPKFRSE